MIKFQDLLEKLPKAQLRIHKRKNRTTSPKRLLIKILRKQRNWQRRKKTKLQNALRKIEYEIKQKEIEIELHRFEEESALKLVYDIEALDSRDV